jgi:hypothetical protein
MVELNDSYDQLKTFFEENPSGEPPGGWSPKNTTPEDEYRGDDNTMDWKSWQYDQEQDWDSELQEWYQIEQKRREAQKTDDEKGRRKTIVKTTKVMLIAAFFYLLAGHTTGHVSHQINSSFNKEYMEGKRQYDLETNGTANGAYAMSRSEILAQDNPRIQQQNYEDKQEQSRNGTSLLMLVALGTLLILVFRSQKAADFVDAYVEGDSDIAENEEKEHVQSR